MHPAERAVADPVPDGCNTGLALIGQADTGQRGCLLSQPGHFPGGSQCVRQGFLAQHVLAGLKKPFDHLQVQAVGYDDADHVNAGVTCDARQSVSPPLIAVAPGGRPG